MRPLSTAIHGGRLFTGRKTSQSTLTCNNDHFIFGQLHELKFWVSEQTCRHRGYQSSFFFFFFENWIAEFCTKRLLWTSSISHYKHVEPQGQGSPSIHRIYCRALFHITNMWSGCTPSAATKITFVEIR